MISEKYIIRSRIDANSLNHAEALPDVHAQKYEH
jgi:hypothetical protein